MAEKEKGYTALVVDDEAYICQLLQRWIMEAGYLCKTAHGGAEALELLEKYEFSVIITDIMMPEITGLDILKHVARTGDYTPVIIITALEEQESIKQAYALGAYGYMNKPLNQNEVLSNILNALRRRKLEIENKRYSESLEKVLDRRTKEIEGALDSISTIMKEVVEDGNFDIRYANPQIPECSVVMNCGKEDCPCYGNGKTRCWQTAGTYCGGETQGRFLEKYGKCSECPVFKVATEDYGQKIGEHFNNMMNMLATKHHELEEAYERLKNSKK